MLCPLKYYQKQTARFHNRPVIVELPVNNGLVPLEYGRLQTSLHGLGLSLLLFDATCYLETCLIGGKRFTTREALDRFFSTITAVAKSHSTNKQTTTASRQKQIDAADQTLTQRLGK